MTDELAETLLAQAHTALSIYDRSGVVREFEDAFADYVGVSRALATSSGTAALHSIYYGAGIGPGDEVICSDYGFFATATPLLQLGATPVFVDCGTDGTISAEAAGNAVTGRTKAIVVTHMWGKPGPLHELRALCERKGLLLLEDCSHAHGARFGQRVVGGFGDAAAWSMQAKKTVWAGEGGVLCTDNDDLLERSLLLGHFNLRALQDIPPSSPNFRLAFTGTGLKYRAHPLGLALALPQLRTLDQLIQGRQRVADVLINALCGIPGVRILSRSTDEVTHSYYSLVALIDPGSCGFDRDLFLRALHAENVFIADIPRQMGSINQYPVFCRGMDAPSTEEDAVPNSRRFTATAVKFFVSSDVDDHASEVALCAEAIHKIGARLPAVSAAFAEERHIR